MANTANNNDFVVKVSLDVDSNSIATLQKTIGNITTAPIPVRLDITNAQNQINALRNQIQALNNIQVNIGGNGNNGIGGGGGQRNRIPNNVTRAYQELISLQSRLTSKFQTLNKLDTSKSQKEIIALTNQINNLHIRYTTLYGLFNSRFNNVQLDRLNRNFDISAEKIELINSKVNDVKANLSQGITLKFNGGTIDNEVSKLNLSLSQIKTQSNQVTTSFQQFNTALNNLNLAINSGDMNAIIATYDRYEQALKEVKNQIDINIRAEKEAARIAKETEKEAARIAKENVNATKLADAKKRLNSDISKWLRDNSAAAKKFESQLDDIKLRINSADKDDLDHLKNEFKEVTREAERLGLATKTFGDRLYDQASKLATYYSASAVFMHAMQGAKAMYDNVLKVDTAMTELYRVTDLTAEQYDSLYDNMTKSAKEYGVALNDIITSTADWVKMGFAPDEANRLAEITTMYQHISDLENDVAVENLVTAYKGFQDELLGLYDGDKAKAVEYIADVYNELGNNFAVTADGVGDAMTRAASALDLAGNTFQESSAMITGIAEVTQDYEKSGSALKILSLRLRGMKGQLEELGEETDENVENISKMQGQILNLTHGKVNIFDTSGNFKSTYEIMDGIAEIWDTLNSIEQADLLETIAGKHRANDVAALLSNWKQVEEAVISANKAEGSASEENARYLESLQGKIDTLIASWQALSNTILNSELLKTGIELLTLFINALDDIINHIGILNAAIATFSIGKIFTTGIKIGGIKELADILPLLSEAFPKASKGAEIFTLTLSKGSGIVNFFKAALLGLWTVAKAHPFVAIISIITLLLPLFSDIKSGAEEAEEAMDNAFSKYDEAKSKVESVNSELETTKARMQELENKKGLTFVEQEELEKLRESTELLQIQAQLAKDEKIEAAKEAANAAMDAYNENFKHEISKNATDEEEAYADSTGNNSYLFIDESNISAMLAGIRQMKELREEAEHGSDDWKHFNSMIEETESTIKSQLKVLNDYYNDLDAIPVEELTDEQKEFKETLNETIKYVYSELDPAKWKDIQFGKIFDDEALNKQKQELVEFVKEYRRYGLTIDDISHENREAELRKYQEGGSVDLLLRPVVDTSELEKVGWEDAGEGAATVFSSTFSNEAGDIAINFTPIIADENGNYIGTLSPEELQTYAEDVISGARKDDLNLQIGAKFEGENAIAEAEKVGARISQLHGEYFLDDNELINKYQPLITAVKNAGFEIEDLVNQINSEAGIKKIATTAEEVADSVDFSFRDLFGEGSAFEASVDAYVKKVNSLKDTLEDYKNGDFSNDDLVQLIKDFPELAGQTDNLEEAITNLLENLNNDMLSEFSEQFGLLNTEEDIKALQDFQDAVMELGTVVGQTHMSIDIETESKKLDDLVTSVSESNSGKGLSTDSIKNIKDMFSGIEGFDVSKLFEYTEHGVRIDDNELRNLYNQYESNIKEDLDDQLDDLITDYRQANAELEALEPNTAAWYQKLSEVQDIETQIQEVLELRAQYEGLTSDYNKWILAQETDDQDLMYNNISDSLEEIQELYKMGRIGVDDYRAAVQMMTDIDLSEWSDYDLSKVYTEGMAAMKKYFTGDGAGLLNFLNDGLKLSKQLGEEWITLDENGVWHVDMTVDGDEKLAEALSNMSGLEVSTEEVQILLRAMEAYGFDVNISSAYASIEELKTKVEEVKESLKLDDATISALSVNVAVDELQAGTEIDKIKKLVDQVKNDEIKIEPELKEDALEYLYVQYDAIVEKYNQPLYMSVDVKDVEEEFQKPLLCLQEYQRALNEANKQEFRGNADAAAKAIEEANGYLEDFLKSADEEILLKLGISGEDNLDTVKEKITNLEEDALKEILVQLGVDVSAFKTDVEKSREILGTLVDDETLTNLTVNVDCDKTEIDAELELLKTKIEEVNNSEIAPEVKTAEIEYLNAQADLLIEKAGQTLVMKVDSSEADAEYQNMITLLQDYQRAVTEVNQLKFKGIDGDELTTATNKVDTLKGKILELPLEQLTKIGLDPNSNTKDIDEAIANIDDEILISLGVGEDTVSQLIAEVDGQEVTVDVTTAGLDAVNTLKSAINEINSKSVIVSVTVFGTSLVNNLSEAIKKVGTKTVAVTAIPIGKDAVDKLFNAIKKIEAKTVDVKAKVYGTDDVNDLYKAIDKLDDKTVDIKAIVSGKSDVDNLASSVRNLQDKTITVTTNYRTTGTGGAGSSKADGTAFAQGNWGTKDSGVSLVGELGQELVVRDGRFFTIGDNSAEFFNYKKGDIIFNADQTKEILENGKITRGKRRGKAFANGTVSGKAYAGGSNAIGSITANGNVVTNANQYNSSTGKSSSSSTVKKFKKVFDWIEIAIDRIERAIDRLDKKASSKYKSWTNRNTALKEEISAMREEIDLQYKAYNEYIKEANSVGLSENYAKLVREGKIDIETITDENLANKIDEYQQWYEKALNCREAIEELAESISGLYEVAFENIVSEYDGIISIINHEKNMLDEFVTQSELNGYITSTKYFEALANNEQKVIDELKVEKDKLLAALQDGMENGLIEQYSESWYDMVNQIDEVTLAIQEGENAILEYANSIREIEWEVFDLVQERISNVTEEAEFLIDLMSNDKLYDEKGQLTDAGMSTMGLHGMNYNAYMHQADKYAKEIRKIDRQIAENPYNQELINRRQELLELQQESILASEKEKDAIVDMVEEGIQLELDYLKDLIDTYTDALDAQKDLYDYQKKVAEQTKEIAKLEKQLYSYAGDNSEESKKIIQEIKVSLEEAKNNLEETEYERYISEQKKLLDDLYLEYETILNMRLDNIDALISDMILEINNNADIISSSLSETADSVNYVISEEMANIWDSSKPVLEAIQSEISSSTTSVTTVLNTIETDIQDMIKDLDVIAQHYIDEAAKSSAANSSQANTSNKNYNYDYSYNGSSGSLLTKAQQAQDPTNLKYTGDGKEYVSFDGGKTYLPTGGTTQNPHYEAAGDSKNQTFDVIHKSQSDSYYSGLDKSTSNYTGATGKQYSVSGDGTITVSRPDGTTSTVSPGSSMYSVTKSAMQTDIKGRASGVKDLSKDEISWTQEKGREFIIRPSDNAILTPLKKGDSVLNANATNNIWDMANDPASFIKDNLKLDVVDAPIGRGNSATYTQHLDNVVFNFPNVKSYDEMLSAMKSDRNFEKLVLAMTIDRLDGKSSLAKGKTIR